MLALLALLQLAALTQSQSNPGAGLAQVEGACHVVEPRLHHMPCRCHESMRASEGYMCEDESQWRQRRAIALHQFQVNR